MRSAKIFRSLGGLVAGAAACLASAGQAAPGDTSTTNGEAAAIVVQPLQIVAVDQLRFGVIQSSPVAGTVTVSPEGVISSSFDLSAFPSTRAPAYFVVAGERNRRFISSISNSTVISNANGATMIVSDLDFTRTNAPNPINRLNAAGTFNLYVGGELNVQADQEPGNYSGVFDVTVLYL